MTDSEFNSEFNKKLLYYRVNVAANVYTNSYTGKDQSCFCSDMHAVHARRRHT